MKIPINLASQPFRRDRAMLAASIGVSLLLAATLAGLVLLALEDRAQLADVRADITRLNRQVRAAQTQQAQYDAVLRKPENAEVLDRSVFLNALLVRKGISWSRIFADLEKIVPHNVRVVQIRPSVDARDRVFLDMQVASNDPTPTIELLKALGSSPLFSHPDIKLWQSPTQSEPLWRYRVSVEYAQKL
jgi:type IV pilus assembly protein PilN